MASLYLYIWTCFSISICWNLFISIIPSLLKYQSWNHLFRNGMPTDKQSPAEADFTYIIFLTSSLHFYVNINLPFYTSIAGHLGGLLTDFCTDYVLFISINHTHDITNCILSSEDYNIYPLPMKKEKM